MTWLNKRSVLVAAGIAILSACVTINVYFPAAEAQRAADEFIRDVLGTEAKPASEPTAGIGGQRVDSLALVLIYHLVAPAHAQANIDINTPQINEIKSRMAQRQRQSLAAFFDAGAIGLSNDGLVQIRDHSAVPLKDRRGLENIVAEENRDRVAVYREIARANGHPEWETQIRDTFSGQWISNARSGWYYQNSDGSWARK